MAFYYGSDVLHNFSWWAELAALSRRAVRWCFFTDLRPTCAQRTQIRSLGSTMRKVCLQQQWVAGGGGVVGVRFPISGMDTELLRGLGIACFGRAHMLIQSCFYKILQLCPGHTRLLGSNTIYCYLRPTALGPKRFGFWVLSFLRPRSTFCCGCRFRVFWLGVAITPASVHSALRDRQLCKAAHSQNWHPIHYYALELDLLDGAEALAIK